MNTMSVQDLHDLFDEFQEVTALAFAGTCADCAGPVEVVVTLADGAFVITGGGVFKNPRWDGKDEARRFRCKCDPCMQKDPTMAQSADVYSRVVGYMQPVGQWNDGKRAEFARRKTYDRSIGEVALWYIPGITEEATPEEAMAGTDTTKPVSPSSIMAAFK